MIMGMATVMVFLSVMMFCIQGVAQATKEHTDAELKKIEEDKARARRVESDRKKAAAAKLAPAPVNAPVVVPVPVSVSEGEVPIAVFCAAIAAFEADQAQ